MPSAFPKRPLLSTSLSSARWRRGACLALALASASVALAQTRLSIGQRTGSSGGQISTPIEVASQDGLVGLQMDLQFNSSEVNLSSVTAPTYDTDHTLRSELVSDGNRRLLVYSPTNAELADGVIGQAESSLLEGYADGQNAFTVAQLRFVDETGAVLDVGLAPFVRLTAPSGGATLAELETTTLSSVAFETDGALTRVEFLVDGRVVATDTSAPYSASWQVDGLGNTLLSAIAYDADGDSAPSPETLVSVQAAAFLADWREEHFSAAEREDATVGGIVADPDGDRIMNFLEFAFGLDPRSADLDGLPNGVIESENGQDFLALYFEKPENLDSLNYVVEVSNDLVNWETADDAVQQELLETVDGRQRFRGQAIAPIEDGQTDKRFIRVRVELAE